MKRVLAVLIFILLPAVAFAQITVSNWQQFSAGFTTTGPILFPDGTCTLPSVSFSTDPDTGMLRTTANHITWATSGSCTALMASTNFRVRSDMVIGWSSSTDPSAATYDTAMRREAAASVQLGDDNASGAAVDQTLSAADAITAADIAGGDLTIQSGAGMGTPVSALIFQTPTVAAAGANPQSLATRLTISSAGIVSGTGVGFETPENMQIGATKVFRIAGRGKIGAGSDGVMILSNDGVTDFTRLQLGGTTEAFAAIAPSAAVASKTQGIIILPADGVAAVFADLGAATNGSMIYCSDCTIANPCAGSGTGAIAKRLNGAWVCN